VPIRPLDEDGDPGWPAVLRAAPLLVLYKHSPWCGASMISERRIRDFSAAHPDLPVYLIDVIDQRDLSARIAATLGVGHESPQVILVRDGAPVWNTSHFRITRAALEDAIVPGRAAGPPAPSGTST